LALPLEIEYWPVPTLGKKLIKIGAKVVNQGRYVTFRLAEVAVPRILVGDILRRIDRLGSKPSLT
jgi:hypothetical protein